MANRLATEEAETSQQDLQYNMLHHSEVNIHVIVQNLFNDANSGYLKVEAVACDSNWIPIGLVEYSQMIIRRRMTKLSNGQAIEDMELTLISYLVSLLKYRHDLQSVRAYLADAPSKGVFQMKVEIGSKFSFGMLPQHGIDHHYVRFIPLD